jgi:hypothetical protein
MMATEQPVAHMEEPQEMGEGEEEVSRRTNNTEECHRFNGPLSARGFASKPPAHGLRNYLSFFSLKQFLTISESRALVIDVFDGLPTDRNAL